MMMKPKVSNAWKTARGNTRKDLTVTPRVAIGSAAAILALAFIGLRVFDHVAFPPNQIDAAALAAAGSISRIVVDTPEFGFVSLADSPADGVGTEAGDGFALPVRGINTIIATSRLDLIIADKLQQPLMEELAERDRAAALSAKEQLIAAIKSSLDKSGSAKDRMGVQVQPLVEAESAFVNADNDGKFVPGSLRLSLGSLDGGDATTVKLPEPQSSDQVKAAEQVEGFYKSFVNVPYKNVDFVFGGVGKSVKLVASDKWRAEIAGLPYQIPTIVKVEIVESDATGKIQNVKAIACAQPASFRIPAPSKGALTMSFPDGPVPEISRPADCYSSEQLNSVESGSMDLLSAQSGDFPLDSESAMAPLKWPLTNSVAYESTANVWRLALYDWIRGAGTAANIDSVVDMQRVQLDKAKPGNILWTASTERGKTAEAIEPISSGIAHIFEFDKDGVVVYRSKMIEPYPLYVASDRQLYGEKFGAITYSTIGIRDVFIPNMTPPKKIVFRAVWDVYIRDNVRNLGPKNGGKHGGEPLSMPVLAASDKPDTQLQAHRTETETWLNQWSETPYEVTPTSDDSTVGVDQGKGLGQGKGAGMVGLNGQSEMGYQPLVACQSDFAESMSPNAPFVRPMPFGRGTRPTFASSGSSVDIKFRRQIDVTELQGCQSTGYLGAVSIDK
ncbi:MAG: hypothetical protein SGJ27_29320 [Candidatus Melainabacteria bacterium]|nr:hypothetical protein [Candidatus Melainabacteria bacterium]